MTSTTTLCKEYLKYDAVIYCLQNIYDEFLEYKNLYNDQVIEMTKVEIENFWDEYEIYTFGPSNYSGYTEIPMEKSKINAKINMDYNKGVNICGDQYLYNSQLLNCIYSYYWSSWSSILNENLTRKQYIQNLLLEPKLELK